MSDFDPTQKTTELESINQVLHLLGREPLASLPSFGADPLSDAVRNALDMETRSVCEMGWGFNTVTVEITPNGSDEIVIPDNYLEFDVGDPNLVEAGGKLLNREKNSTTEFTSDVKGCAVLAKDFADCPQPIRQLIVARAAWTMQSYAAETEFQRALEIGVARAKRKADSYQARTGGTMRSNPEIAARAGYRYRRISYH